MLLGSKIVQQEPEAAAKPDYLLPWSSLNGTLALRFFQTLRKKYTIKGSCLGLGLVLAIIQKKTFIFLNTHTHTENAVLLLLWPDQDPQIFLLKMASFLSGILEEFIYASPFGFLYRCRRIIATDSEKIFIFETFISKLVGLDKRSRRLVDTVMIAHIYFSTSYLDKL